MVTDRDREFAYKQAQLIYENHLKHGRAGCDANHIATNLSYREALRRGLLAECAFVHEFGGAVRTELNQHGDGGRDFSLLLLAGEGAMLYPVNVKAKSVQLSWYGLMKSGTHLRVPVKETNPKTIYVFAIYHELADDAEVLRWEWGQTLIDHNQRITFVNGNGEECYTQLFQELRNLNELKNMMIE